MIFFFRALRRLITFALMAGTYILAASLANLIKGTQLSRNLRLRRILVKNLIRMLGVKIEYEGPIPEPPALLVSNHRSYFDPIAVFQNVPALAVGKSEVGSWPIIGNIAKMTGTIFVKRSNAADRQAAGQMIAESIQSGHIIINFPEGTTHVEPKTISFKKGAFIIAAEHKLPVIPMAVDYLDPEDAWVGDDTFIRHFFQCFGKKTTNLKISYGHPLLADNPFDLLQNSQTWIDTQLLKFNEEWVSSSQRDKV